MGNRAVITTKENLENNGVGVYIHWCGGMRTIQAFLLYCKLHGYRNPEEDSYGWARLCTVICNYFSDNDGLSCGIDVVNNLDCDNGDNGTYLIRKWDVVGKAYSDHEEITWSPSDLVDSILDINHHMPENEQLNDIYIIAKIREGEI